MKKDIIFIFCGIAIALGIPYVIDQIVIGNKTIEINVTNPQFFSFLGSYLGGAISSIIIIGGTLKLDEKKEKKREDVKQKEKEIESIKRHLLFFNTIYLEYSNLKDLYSSEKYINFREADTKFLRTIILGLDTDYIDYANKKIFDLEQEYNNRKIIEFMPNATKLRLHRKNIISKLVENIESFPKNKKESKPIREYWEYYNQIFKNYEEQIEKFKSI